MKTGRMRHAPIAHAEVLSAAMEIELSGWIVTLMIEQWLATAASRVLLTVSHSMLTSPTSRVLPTYIVRPNRT